MYIQVSKEILEQSGSFLDDLLNTKPRSKEEVAAIKQKIADELLNNIADVLIRADYPDATLPDSKEKYLLYAQALIDSGWVSED